jgi:hypothetical protein
MTAANLGGRMSSMAAIPSAAPFHEINGMRRATRPQIAAGLAIVPMLATTLWLGARCEHLQRPVAATVYWSYLIAASAAIGLYWWHRRPASRFGPLPVLFGLLV